MKKSVWVDGTFTREPGPYFFKRTEQPEHLLLFD